MGCVESEKPVVGVTCLQAGCMLQAVLQGNRYRKQAERVCGTTEKWQVVLVPKEKCLAGSLQLWWQEV